MNLRNIPPLSNHGSEVGLLAMLGAGVLVILGIAVARGKLDGLDVAAFLLVLQRIIEAVQKRWEQRSVDELGRSLANAPPADPPAGTLPEGEA